VIRRHSHAVTQRLKAGGGRNDLLDRRGPTRCSPGVDFERVLAEAISRAGRRKQVDEFLAQEVRPIRDATVTSWASGRR